jgi:hypothetical protein
LGLILAMGVGSAAWTAKLESKDGSKISGTARVETVAAPMTPPKDSLTPPAAPAEAGEELRVSVTLSNAPANASLGWGLYTGKCSDTSAGSILGSPTAYSPVKIDGQGNGTATSMVKGAKVAGGNYYVGVQGDGGKMAACGNLEPAKTSTD